jgi:hypothetical protein
MPKVKEASKTNITAAHAPPRITASANLRASHLEKFSKNLIDPSCLIKQLQIVAY